MAILRCPKCNSKVIAPKREPGIQFLIVMCWMFVVTIPIAIFLIAYAKKNECMSCGFVFED